MKASRPTLFSLLLAAAVTLPALAKVTVHATPVKGSTGEYLLTVTEAKDLAGVTWRCRLTQMGDVHEVLPFDLNTWIKGTGTPGQYTLRLPAGVKGLFAFQAASGGEVSDELGLTAGAASPSSVGPSSSSRPSSSHSASSGPARSPSEGGKKPVTLEDLPDDLLELALGGDPVSGLAVSHRLNRASLRGRTTLSLSGDMSEPEFRRRLAQFPNLRELKLGRLPNVLPGDLARALAHLTQLRTLTLDMDAPILPEDAFLALVERNKHLEALDVTMGSLTGAVLAQLRSRLVSLKVFCDYRMDDSAKARVAAAFDVLPTCKALTSLDIAGLNAFRDGQMPPRLLSLRVVNSPAFLGNGLPSGLVTLKVIGCRAFGTVPLSAGLTTLKTVSAELTGVTVERLLALVASSSLESFCTELPLTDVQLASLPATQMESLSLRASRLERPDFLRFTRLRNLRLQETPLLDAGTLPASLEYLDLGGVRSFMGSHHLTRLRKLRLQGCEAFQKSQELTGLQDLLIWHCPDLPLAPPEFTLPASLMKFVLVDFDWVADRVTDLPLLLASLPNLRSFEYVSRGSGSRFKEESLKLQQLTTGLGGTWHVDEDGFVRSCTWASRPSGPAPSGASQSSSSSSSSSSH